MTQTLNSCESKKAELVVTVKPISVIPTVADSVLTFCQTYPTTPLTATGTGLKWYTTLNGTTPLAGAPSPSTTIAGSVNYYVSQTTTGACESPRKKIEIVTKDTPLAPTVTTPVEYCVGATATPLTPSGAAYKWYTTQTGGTALATTPLPVTTTAGTTNYYVSHSNSYTVAATTLLCESPRTNLKVTINALPASLSTTSEVFCQTRTDSTFTLKSTATTGNTINWYNLETGGTKLNTVPSVNVKNAGTSTFYAVQVNAKLCESSTRVAQTVRVKPLPLLPTLAQTAIVYCQFDQATPLSATPQSNATLNWYGTSATGGTSSATPPTPSTLTGGTTSFYVAQTLEACIGDRAKIDVTINTTPKPSTTTALAYCQGEVAPALSATGSSLKWYLFSDGQSQGNPYTPFTEKVQDYSFFVTQTGTNGCESPKEEIKIHIKALPSATISGNSTINFGESASINLQFTSDGPWNYILSDGTSKTANSSSTTIAVKPPTTTTYLVTEVSNACGKGTPIGFAVVSVRVPTISSGNPSVASVCAGQTFNLPFQQSGTFPAESKFVAQISKSNSPGSFYSIPSVATASSITATIPDSTLSGSYYVRVISENSNPAFNLAGSIGQINLQVDAKATATISGTQTVVIGDPATLTVNLTGNAPWAFYLNNGSTDSLFNVTTSPVTIKISPIKTTTYTISSVANVCGNNIGKGSARVQVDPVLGIEPTPTDWVNVYPTMVQDKCIVEMKSQISDAGIHIELINQSGVILKKQQSDDQFNEINFSDLNSGLYLIRVKNGPLNGVFRVLKP